MNKKTLSLLIDVASRLAAIRAILATEKYVTRETLEALVDSKILTEYLGEIEKKEGGADADII